MRRACLIPVAAGLLLGAAACTPRVNTRGYLADKDTVAAIRPGVDTRSQVEDKLGSPSTTATFDDNTWYYIGKKTKKVAFFKPEVTEQRVVAVRFDDGGKVKAVKQYSLADAQDVDITSRVSKTRGRELTVLQQLYQLLLRGRSNAPGYNTGFKKPNPAEEP